MTSSGDSKTARTTVDIIKCEKSNESFLSILDDKNKLISILQQQLENQKSQIMYYLNKEIAYTKITELSTTCTSDNVESLPVILSLQNFKNQNGINSKIQDLYEYMKHVDNKLNRNLNCQEFILRKLVEKLCGSIKNNDRGKNDFENKNNVIICPGTCLDLFSSLLDVTVNVRKKLDLFRICCNRLILVEDERNNLVEQVISLPVDQKLQSSIFMNMHQEKIDLKRTIKKMQYQQKINANDIQLLEGNLNGLHNQIRCSIMEAEDFSDVGDLIDSLKLDARMLLGTTEKYREKQQFLPNAGTVVKLIKIAGQNGQIITDNKEELEIFEAIKKEMYKAQSKLLDEVQLITSENECTKRKLKAVLLQTNELKLIKNELQNRIGQMQISYANETALLRQQRDAFKAQIEDLEVIREAYTKMIVKPSLAYSNRENELARTIKHLEKKLHLMKEIMSKQNTEIILQSEFISNLKNYYKNKQNGESPTNCCCNEYSSVMKRRKRNLSEKSFVVKEISTWSREKQNGNMTSKAVQPDSSERFSSNSAVVDDTVEATITDVDSNKTSLLPSFSLEIKCNCRKGLSNTDQCNCKELELMKDCSRESLPVFCSPLRKNNVKTSTNSSLDNKYSRNIEVLVHNNKLHSSSEEYTFGSRVF